MTTRQDSKITQGIKRGTPQAAAAHEIAQLLAGRDTGLSITEIRIGIGRRAQLTTDTVHAMCANGTLARTTTRRGTRDITLYRLADTGITRLTAGAARPTHCQMILDRLRKGPATHLELYQLGTVAHSRIADLRHQGHKIDQDMHLTPGGQRLYIYTLIEPATATAEAA